MAAERELSSEGARQATGMGDIDLPAEFKLASWSPSPRRVLRSGCDHTYTVDSETEEKERHPNIDGEYVGYGSIQISGLGE